MTRYHAPAAGTALAAAVPVYRAARSAVRSSGIRGSGQYCRCPGQTGAIVQTMAHRQARWRTAADGMCPSVS